MATNPSIPFTKMTLNSNDIIVIDFIVGLVAKGSVLDLQLKDFSNMAIRRKQSVVHQKTLNNSNISSNSSSKIYDVGNSFDTAKDAQEMSQGKYGIISPPKQQPVSLHEISEWCKKIKCKRFVDVSEIEKIKTPNGLNIGLIELQPQDLTGWHVHVSLANHLLKS